jgi:hypothetical protein
VSGGDYGEKDHKTCLPFAVPPSAQTQALARGATVPTPKCPKPVACDATFAKTYNKTWATDKHKAGQPYFCNVKSGAEKRLFCAILKTINEPFYQDRLRTATGNFDQKGVLLLQDRRAPRASRHA